jgi:hypothetical protein
MWPADSPFSNRFSTEQGSISSRAFFMSVWTRVWPVVLSSFLGFLEPDFPPDPRCLGLSYLRSHPSWRCLFLSYFLRLGELSFEECFFCSIRNSSIARPTLHTLPT